MKRLIAVCLSLICLCGLCSCEANKSALKNQYCKEAKQILEETCAKDFKSFVVESATAESYREDTWGFPVDGEVLTQTVEIKATVDEEPVVFVVDTRNQKIYWNKHANKFQAQFEEWVFNQEPVLDCCEEFGWRLHYIPVNSVTNESVYPYGIESFEEILDENDNNYQILGCVTYKNYDLDYEVLPIAEKLCFCNHVEYKIQNKDDSGRILNSCTYSKGKFISSFTHEECSLRVKSEIYHYDDTFEDVVCFYDPQTIELTIEQIEEPDSMREIISNANIASINAKEYTNLTETYKITAKLLKPLNDLYQPVSYTNDRNYNYTFMTENGNKTLVERNDVNAINFLYIGHDDDITYIGLTTDDGTKVKENFYDRRYAGNDEIYLTDDKTYEIVVQCARKPS